MHTPRLFNCVVVDRGLIESNCNSLRIGDLGFEFSFQEAVLVVSLGVPDSRVLFSKPIKPLDFVEQSTQRRSYLKLRLDLDNFCVSISGRSQKSRVLKTREKVVSICVNGEEANFHIYSDHKGKEILKKMVRFISPTSEQLASLNLKEGRNTVTFKFSTPMLGKEQINASIYLWKWNTRIVVSDVDGTITKSDVRGQFMPLVGVDWSHTGVAHLFSAIKADYTRQFLLDLKQDGKALPDGPVVISPDGLLPSFYGEVIRRVPHEFKIKCLKGIRSLFPSNCHPFYAGFGNRYTDEFSYLKVGIPQGKIFIINPKGEVAVNGRVALNHTDPCMLMSMACSHPRPRRSSGPIPAAIGNLRSLTTIKLFMNNITGSIPIEMNNLTNLEDFQISRNFISGNLPENICRGGRLTWFEASYNNLPGSIPKSLRNCSTLFRVGLAGNQLTGNVTEDFGIYSNLVYITLSNKKFVGGITGNWGKCPKLVSLEMSNNKITGRIPSGLGNATKLHLIDLSRNLMVGEVPKELGKLKLLFSLKLNNNNLSGKVPTELGILSELQEVDLSANN
ncbi:hypothetical protein FNV43_RR00333 [Rhamnella rubrinervis]|uniref:LNS2/PITP domain-containing protein n=1 Tax=Rhamnella rubrinervis TaxID=2594499 RepID=A0A8K0MR26_9ROSA|nr:hypothetical protein FNV43_RR00333 [Rhamnella rubrinervis]